ncbi:MAG TPA: hypothetical protein EYP98_22115, partial [Planctomycetes bacterium]|nr:hypothetical protein [Planctomycetota bacterium]
MRRLRLTVGGVLVAAGLAGHSFRSLGGEHALDGDPNVLLVTVDGLSWSDVQGDGWAAFEEILQPSLTFEEMISPFPASRAAHASLLTGQYPLR